MSEQNKTNKLTIHWDGIDIPMNLNLDKSIQDLIYQEARKIIEKDTAFVQDMLNHVLIDNRKTIIQLLKPILKEMFEEQGFKITVHGWWED